MSPVARSLRLSEIGGIQASQHLADVHRALGLRDALLDALAASRRTHWRCSPRCLAGSATAHSLAAFPDRVALMTSCVYGFIYGSRFVF